MCMLECMYVHVCVCVRARVCVRVCAYEYVYASPNNHNDLSAFLYKRGLQFF